MRRDATRAFTLIELSIVLIVIGLVVGGILVGQNLVFTATARSQIKQIQDLQSQINVFRTKYDCIPGDCSNATTFLGVTDGHGNTLSNGDGDGLIRSTVGTGAPFAAVECLAGGLGGSELPQVFLQLNASGIGNYTPSGSAQNLVSGYLPVALNNNTGILATCLQDNGSLGIHFVNMDSTLNNGNVIVIGVEKNNGNPTNRLLYLTGLSTTQYGTQALGIAPNYAQAIDTKMDDGLPDTGVFGIVSAPSSGCLTGTNIYPTIVSTTCTVTVGLWIGSGE